MAMAGQAQVSAETLAAARAAFLSFGGPPDLPLAPDFFAGRFDPARADDILTALQTGATAAF
jgi:hypothetical protein